MFSFIYQIISESVHSNIILVQTWELSKYLCKKEHILICSPCTVRIHLVHLMHSMLFNCTQQLDPSHKMKFEENNFDMKNIIYDSMNRKAI